MISNLEKILVCGAGQGGHAISAYLSSLGHDVTLYSTTLSKVEEIQNKNLIIEAKGKLEGKFKLKSVTNNLDEAVENNEIIFIVTDANAHKYYAKNLANKLTNQNVILVSPGVGGALEFFNKIKEYNKQQKISVSETDTLVYACKVPESGVVNIKSVKNEILYATVPESNSKFDDFIYKVYPQFKDTKNPLMGMDDSPVFHIVGMVMNAQRIQNKENFNFYIDGITKEYARYMEKMDEERCKVAEAIGIIPRPIKDWLNLAYGVQKSSLFDMIQNTPPYMNTKEMTNRSPAPKTLYHRYLIEEIPLRAVPTVQIAQMFGIAVPRYVEMVNRASELTGIDFWKVGRTVTDMGLNREQILNWNKTYAWDF